MYQIMFVDDDPLILRRLHQVLDWESLDFGILPDAVDGTDALSKMENCHPDIIICDINMPNMDGLSLAGEVRKKYPHTHCIILTINDSFGCAQQALNIGVDHYLLKPIIPSKIEELIQTICAQLNESKKQNQYLSTLYNKALLSEKMIRDKFLNWIVSGRQPLSEEQLIQKFEFYQLPSKAKNFQIISIHINPLQEIMLEKDNIEELLKNVTRHIEDILCEYSNCTVFGDQFYHLNILIGTDSEHCAFTPNAQSICQSILDNLLFELNLPVTCFYSRIYTGYQNIYRCYYETKFFSKYTKSLLKKDIISYEEYIETSKNSSINLDNIRSQVLKLLRADIISDLNTYIQKCFYECSLLNTNLENFNILKIDLVMSGIMFLHEAKISVTDVFDKFFDPLSEVMECSTPDTCVSFILHFYSAILDYLRSSKISSKLLLVERAIELIHLNIANPELNVKWLASQLYINENYLSRQFRQERNLSLIKYINITRMETAKEYLNNDCQNLQQVAALSGFSDPLYFSKCFKKYFGVSPSSYLSLVSSK